MIILQDSQIKKIFHNGDEVKKILDWDGNVIFYKQSGGGGMTNTIKFHVGDLNGNTNKTVTVYYSNIKGANNPYITDEIPITEGNRWYVYSIPSGKSLIKFKGIKEITDTIISAKINNKYNMFLKNNHGNVSFIDCIIDDEMTSMSQMFSYCFSPQFFGINNWDVSKITNMNGVFEYCYALETLDLTNWNVENVTRMDSMFHECNSLQKLVGLSNWNVGKVTWMDMMFNSCYLLQNLDLNNWNVSSVTNMSWMFGYCNKLQELNISGWDMTKVTNIDGMFKYCDKLTTIKMIGCNQTTIDKIKSALTSAGILNNVTIITE